MGTPTTSFFKRRSLGHIRTGDGLVHDREPYPSSSFDGVVTYTTACGVRIHGPSTCAARKKKNRRKLRDPRTTEPVTCMACLAEQGDV